MNDYIVTKYNTDVQGDGCHTKMYEGARFYGHMVS